MQYGGPPTSNKKSGDVYPTAQQSQPHMIVIEKRRMLDNHHIKTSPR